MSSTIFSATSGTSISVDPHADVEGAGQQNPAVPHDAQNGAPAPGNPPNEDLLQAEARLRQMLDTALDRSGGLRGIGGDLYDAIKTEIPRPKVFHGGFRIHSAMLKAANACDVAAANLRRIPIADFHANPLPAGSVRRRAERALHPDRRIPEGQRRQRRPARFAGAGHPVPGFRGAEFRRHHAARGDARRTAAADSPRRRGSAGAHGWESHAGHGALHARQR